MFSALVTLRTLIYIIAEISLSIRFACFLPQCGCKQMMWSVCFMLFGEENREVGDPLFASIIHGDWVAVLHFIKASF